MLFVDLHSQQHVTTGYYYPACLILIMHIIFYQLCICTMFFMHVYNGFLYYTPCSLKFLILFHSLMTYACTVHSIYYAYI